ncbi:hypothetical protein F7725_016672 [Dissostichus mawsoni]|uniref:Dynamin-type G domain-containing protein n=1 Tax=Dissostichus mawsoni TaxID=36200 RepID=A0A7J5Z4D6_DISMA|nr:hypothetical protein F7725_016672 [Dissostichus mawsoni]
MVPVLQYHPTQPYGSGSGTGPSSHGSGPSASPIAMVPASEPDLTAMFPAPEPAHTAMVQASVPAPAAMVPAPAAMATRSHHHELSNSMRRRCVPASTSSTLFALWVEKDLALPAIAVIGDQSSGKSSVLEALSGVALPRGSVS